MPRDARALLWDIVQACDAVAGFVTGRDLEGYRGDLLLRSAVERQLGVAGEAMSQLARTEPDLAGQVGEWRSVVAFRNILVHQYFGVDDAVVWSVANDDLPQLRMQVQAMLASVSPDPEAAS